MNMNNMNNMNFYFFNDPIETSITKLKIQGTGQKEIYHSIMNTKLLLMPFINEKQELCFKSQHICGLEDWLQRHKTNNNNDFREHILPMIASLSSQIQYLEKRGLSFLGFNLQDIIVVDDYSFFFANNKYLTFFAAKKIKVMVPIVKPMFSNPELISLVQLPATVSHDCCYYSLGAIVVFLLLDVYLLKGNEIKTEKEIEHILKPIVLTKMYWFLKRCFHKQGQRILLYI